MIHAYELRVGNHILLEGRVRQVTMVCKHTAQINVTVPGAEEKTSTDHTLASAQPILMSDTVLQQCNFVYLEYFKFWQLVKVKPGNRLEMNIDRDYNIIDFMRRPMVKTVASLHQLQNIYFMLKGEELDFCETLA